MGDLDKDVTERDLYNLFSTIGAVSSVRVCTDSVSRRSLGYAYVNFVDTSSAEKAMDTLNYTPLKNQPIRIMWSQRDPSLRRSGTGNVFIKNLDRSVDTKALNDTFSQFGKILSCKVAIEGDGNSKVGKGGEGVGGGVQA